MLEYLIYIVQLLWLIGLTDCFRNFARGTRFEARSAFEEIIFISLTTAFTGYLFFWIYDICYPVGWALSLVSFGLGIRGCVSFFKTAQGKNLKTPLSREWIFAFLALAGLTSLSYPSLIHYHPANLLDWISDFYFKLSNDNTIPRYVAELVRHGGPLVETNVAWQVSDRTPLLSGIYLLFSFFTDTKTYQAVGVIYQLFFFLTLISFFSALGFKWRSLFWVLVLFLFSGFWQHGIIFLWPKDLAVHYALVGFLLLAVKPDSTADQDKQDIRIWSAAALAFIFAYLSHPGIIFSFPIFLVPTAIFLKRTRLKFSQLLKLTLPALSLFAIWIYFQKVIDPPGDRLLKWHLAGVTNPTREPFLKVLRESYAALSFQEIWAARVANIRYLFAPTPWPTNLELWRRAEFLHLALSLGLLWLGILGWPKLLAVQFNKSKIMQSRGERVSFILSIALAFAFWIALIFAPNATANHNHSYFTIFCFAASLVWGLYALNKNLLAAVASLQALWFFYFWVFGATSDWVTRGYTVDLYQIVLSIVFTSGLILFLRTSLSQD